MACTTVACATGPREDPVMILLAAFYAALIFLLLWQPVRPRSTLARPKWPSISKPAGGNPFGCSIDPAGIHSSLLGQRFAKSKLERRNASLAFGSAAAKAIKIQTPPSEMDNQLGQPQIGRRLSRCHFVCLFVCATVFAHHGGLPESRMARYWRSCEYEWNHIRRPTFSAMEPPAPASFRARLVEFGQTSRLSLKQRQVRLRRKPFPPGRFALRRL